MSISIKATVRKWRAANAVTDWEFNRVGQLLCDLEQRDLALMVARLEAPVDLLKIRLGFESWP